MATIYTVLGGTLLNLGVTFSSQGSQAIANGSFVGAGDLLPSLKDSLKKIFRFVFKVSVRVHECVFF